MMVCSAAVPVIGLEGVEEFLSEGIAYAAEQYGTRNEEYIATLTDTVQCLASLPAPTRSALQHQYCLESVKCAKETFGEDSPKYVSLTFSR